MNAFYRFVPRFSVGPAGVEKRSGRQVVRELLEVREQRTHVDEHVTEIGTEKNIEKQPPAPARPRTRNILMLNIKVVIDTSH